MIFKEISLKQTKPNFLKSGSTKLGKFYNLGYRSKGECGTFLKSVVGT